MVERNFTVVGDDYEPNSVSKVDLDKLDKTLFAKKYPKLLKYMLERKDNVRFDFSVATMQNRIADLTRRFNKHELGDFFYRSPFHMYLKFTVTKNAIQSVQQGSSRLGTPIADLKTLYPGNSPSDRTKDAILTEAVDKGYLLKTKELVGKKILIVPTDVLLAAHFIENSKRLDALNSSGIIDIIIQAKGEIDEIEWLPDLNWLLSEEDKKMLNFKKD